MFSEKTFRGRALICYALFAICYPSLAILFCFFLRDAGVCCFNCAFSVEISSRSAAISLCTSADPRSSFDSLALAGADRKGAATGIHGRKKLAADDAAAAGSIEVKW